MCVCRFTRFGFTGAERPRCPRANPLQAPAAALSDADYAGRPFLQRAAASGPVIFSRGEPRVDTVGPYFIARRHRLVYDADFDALWPRGPRGLLGVILERRVQPRRALVSRLRAPLVRWDGCAAARPPPGSASNRRTVGYAVFEGHGQLSSSDHENEPA